MYSDTQIWKRYEKAVGYHRKIGLVEDTQRAFRFYEGDQWHGLSSDEIMPSYNFIAPTVRYKVAMTAMNQMSICFSGQQNTLRGRKTLQYLNQLAMLWWERLKMDSICWKMIKESAIAGDCYLYFYNEKGDCQLLDNTNVFLGDETQPDLQRQPYIIIYERRPVEDVLAEAKKNGVDSGKLASIMSDSEAEHLVSTVSRPQADDGMVSSLLYMTRKGDDLYFSRSTRFVEYQPQQCIKGMRLYPMVSLVINQKKGSARGRGEVQPMIANQIEVNRNLARRLINAKMTAFSRLVYAADKIDNPQALNEIGTAIEINDANIADVRNVIGYVTPSAMSPDAKVISDEMIRTTRDLAGAGDAATGEIDPTKASGVAIIAVRDQTAISLNEMFASFRQMIEDVARVWYEMWICYNPGGILLPSNEKENALEKLDAGYLRRLNPLVRVDVSSVTPFSKYTREQALERLFEKNAITFEEYVQSLDDDAAAPKGKLKDILRSRQVAIQTGNEEATI